MPQLIQDDLAQARSLEGSVFDDWWSWLRRLGADDPTGGLGPSGGMNVGAGIVRNEAHPAFRMLQRTAPREAAHLQRSPSIVRYADANPEDFSKQGIGATTIPIGVPYSGGRESARHIRQSVVANDFRSPPRLPEQAWKEMANTPGSSLQLYPRGVPLPAQTPLHEAGHALRLARSGGRSGTPSISPTKAEDVLEQAWEEGLIHSDYKGDYIHAALDALARLRTGGFRVR